MNPGDRPQLYKIRRLLKAGPMREHYQWWTRDGWALDQIDGEAFTSIAAAQKIVEPMKAKNKDPDVIFHSVVPV